LKSAVSGVIDTPTSGLIEIADYKIGDLKVENLGKLKSYKKGFNKCIRNPDKVVLR
jgi:hypothetical protein